MRRWWTAVAGLALVGALGWAASTAGGERRLETVVPDPPGPVAVEVPPDVGPPDVATLVALAQAAAAEQPFPQVCATLLGVNAQLAALPAVPDHVIALIGRLLRGFGCPGLSDAPPVCEVPGGVNLATPNRVRAQVPGGTTVTLGAGEKTTVGSPRNRCIASTSLVVSTPPGAVTYAVVQGGVEVRCNAVGGGSVRVNFDDALSPNPFFITVICT